jgi:hypothetical protein
MGNGIPPDKRPLPPVADLAHEKPTQLMVQLRAAWPKVQEASKAEHTLRLIHKRLNRAGVPISYKRLSSYRCRIERRNKTTAQPASQIVEKTSLVFAKPVVLASDHSKPDFDPLANLRLQEQKWVGWQYPSGPPDERRPF